MLGFVRNGDRSAFFAYFFVPGRNTEEPVIGRRIGGPSEEDRYQEVMNSSGSGGRSGCQPYLVAFLQVRHGGDGKRLAGAGHMDFNFGSGEVKTGSCLGMGA